jgi:uncharacterized repeat protein (TIGR01451 family)
MKRLLGLTAACLVGGLIIVAIMIGPNRQAVQARTPPFGCVMVDADIATPTTWALPACYRVVTGTVAILTGASLTIEPGVEVYFDLDSRLQINQGAGLTAVGTGVAPILFTSAAATGSEQRCDWEGILINSDTGPSVEIQHAIIEYACIGIDPGGRRFLTFADNLFQYNGDGLTGGAIVGDTDFSSISNNEIHSCQNGILLNEAGNNELRGNTVYNIDQHGIAVLRGGVVGGADNQIDSNIIHHCGANGIRLEDGSDNTITSNTIYECGDAGIVIDEQSAAQLRYNQVFSNALNIGAPAGVLITNNSENVELHFNQISDNGSNLGGYVAALTIQGMASTFNQVVVNGNLISDAYGSGIYYAADNASIPVDVPSNMQNNAICPVPVPSFQLDNQRSGHTIDARYGWWGTNSPSIGVNVNGLADIDPWITLQVTTAPTTVPAYLGATASVLVSMNDGAGHTIPNVNGARTVRLTTSAGTINPSVVTLDNNGLANATFILTDIPAGDQVIIGAAAFCDYVATTALTVERTNVAIDKYKTTPGTQLVRGEPLPYTIEYSNISDIQAYDVYITDTLPAGTRYMSHTSDDPALWCVSGCVVGGTGPLVWRRSVGLPPNTGYVINLTLSTADVNCGDLLENEVIISTATAETTLADNTARTAPVTVIVPSVAIVKTSTLSQSKIGDDVTYVFQVTNTSCPAGSPALILDSILDVGTGWAGLGDLTAVARANGCDPLPYGASCSFAVPYTVPDGAPDPLINVVTALYHPQGFSGVPVTDNDDHTVNLFQPSVQVIKTGDARSKPGDEVTYQFRIINTSSSDSPDLILSSVLDVGDGWPGLGDLTTLALSSGCEPLAPGASCSFSVPYIIPDSAPDPLNNTVTANCRPLGYTNVVSDDDYHTVEIFYPAVEVRKEGNALSKVGDEVTYHFWITNTSSSDSPDLILDSLTDGGFGWPGPGVPTPAPADCVRLAPGESCHFTVPYTVQSGDPDPLRNLFVVHYYPEGFTNDITAFDDHEVNLFQPSVEVNKEGDVLSKVGDEVTYHFWITNTSSSDSPDLILDSLTDGGTGWPGPGVPSPAPADCVRLAPGESCYFTVPYTIQPGNPDPLRNLFVVHYYPEGFTNDITASDDHEVNLFQPSVEVLKTGAGSVRRGEVITYEFWINNTGSSDSPLLIMDSVVDVGIGWPGLGDLTDLARNNNCGFLAHGDSCHFSVLYPTTDSTPDVLTNTVTVTYHPLNFTNVIADDDDHVVRVVEPRPFVYKSDHLEGDNLRMTLQNTSLTAAEQAAVYRLFQTANGSHPLAPTQEPPFVYEGDLITYSIGVFNFGTLTITNVVLTETLPLYTEYVGYGWTRVNSRTYTMAVGTLPPDPAGVLGHFYQFVVRVVDPLPDDAYDVLENRVCVGSDEVTFNPDDHCGYEWTNVRPYPLRVIKSVEDDCISPGRWFEYSITYQNRTTDTTFYDVILTDTLDTYVSYVDDPLGEWSCTGQLCTRTIPSIPPQISGTLLLPVRLDRDFPYPARTAITNVVRIEYGNRYVLPTPIYTGPDLAVAKHGVVWHTSPDLLRAGSSVNGRTRRSYVYRMRPLADPDRLEALWTEQQQQPEQGDVGPGEWIVYRVVYLNRGLGPMTGVVLTETLPEHTSYIGGGWTHAGGRAYSLNLGDLESAEGGEVEFIVQVDASLPPTTTWIYNYVEIGGAEPECDEDNNWAEYYTPVSGAQQTTFTLRKEGPPVANNGDIITYTIVAVNTGSPVSGVTLSDPLPARLQYVDCAYRRNADPSLDVDCNPDYPTLSDILWQEDFDTGDRITTTLSARVRSDLTNSRVQNCATLNWSGGWQRACVDTIIIEGVNLNVTKDDNVGVSLPIEYVQEGDLVTYTVNVVNAGTYTATNVVLTETLPLYTDYVGTGWTHIAGPTYIMAVGTLPPGGGHSYHFVVRVRGPLPDGVNNLVNLVCGWSDEEDLYPNDNCNYEDTPVRRRPLWVEKSADGCITPGDEFNYYITYRNTATTTTFTSIVLTDTLDPYVHYVGTPGDGWVCLPQVCNLTIATIPPGVEATLSLTVQLDGAFPGTVFTNVVEIEEGNRFVLTTTIDTGADLSVVKNDNVGPLPLAQQTRWNTIAKSMQLSPLNPLQVTQHREYVRPGELVTYTILYVNRGLTTAADVVLTERLPDYTTYIGGGWTHAGGQQYTLNVGDLLPGQGGEAHFVVQVDDPFPLTEDRVINLVEIGGSTPECDLGNNQSADDTPVRVSVARGLWLTGRQSDNIIRAAPPVTTGIAQVLDNIHLGDRQRPFGITGDGQYLYVANSGEFPENHDPSARGTLSVLEVESGIRTEVAVGTRPMFVEAMDGCAYVTNYAWSDRGAGGVSIYCPLTDTVATTVLPRVRGFFGIASDPSTNRIFAANRGFERRDGCSGNYMNDWCPGIYILDGNTQQVTGFVPTVEQPYEIAYRSDPSQPPGWGRLYVIVPGEISAAGRSTLDEVWVYESRDSTLETQPAHQIQIGCQLIDAVQWNGGEGIAILGDHVYVSNYCDHTISVIHDPPVIPIPTTTAHSSLPGTNMPLSLTSDPPGTLELPYFLYLPLVTRNHVGEAPRVVRTIDLDNRGTAIFPQDRYPQSPADCTGRCPKGIGFYGDSAYVSLFQSNDILRIDPQDQVAVVELVPDGSISFINQVFGWEW